MQTPEQIAQKMILLGLVPTAQRPALFLEMVAALRQYGDARAAQERDKIIQHIKAEATKPDYADGMEYWHVGGLLDELAAAIQNLE